MFIETPGSNHVSFVMLQKPVDIILKKPLLQEL